MSNIDDDDMSRLMSTKAFKNDKRTPQKINFMQELYIIICCELPKQFLNQKILLIITFSNLYAHTIII